MDGGFYGSSNRMQQRHVSIYEQESILWEQSAKSDSLSKGTTQDALSAAIVSGVRRNVKTEVDADAFTVKKSPLAATPRPKTGVSAAEGRLPKGVSPQRIRVMSPGEESQTPSVKPIPPQVLIDKQGEE